MKLTKKGTISINYRNDPPENEHILICNFKCSYCNQEKIPMYPFTKSYFKQNKLIWDDLSKIEDDIMVKVNFEGEIFVDKWALKCGAYICDVPNVKVCEFITNNSIDPDEYLNKLDNSKITFSCSFHPECISLEDFMKNLDVLKQAGCPVFATMEVTPQIINDLPRICNTFRENKVDFKPVFLLRSHRGKYYPRDYSTENKKLLKKYYRSVMEYEYMSGKKKTKGLDCYAGVDMISVFLNGEVRRCWGYYLGNVKSLVSGKFTLKNEAYSCFRNNCTCVTHLVGMKKFRQNFKLSDKFIGHYRID